MKPWTCPGFQTTCVNCGTPGWNENAYRAWLGAEFVCRGGCDPEAVRQYQRRQAAETRRQADCENGGHI